MKSCFIVVILVATFALGCCQETDTPEANGTAELKEQILVLQRQIVRLEESQPKGQLEEIRRLSENLTKLAKGLAELELRAESSLTDDNATAAQREAAEVQSERLRALEEKYAEWTSAYNRQLEEQPPEEPPPAPLSPPPAPSIDDLPPDTPASDDAKQAALGIAAAAGCIAFPAACPVIGIVASLLASESIDPEGAIQLIDAINQVASPGRAPSLRPVATAIKELVETGRLSDPAADKLREMLSDLASEDPDVQSLLDGLEAANDEIQRWVAHFNEGTTCEEVLKQLGRPSFPSYQVREEVRQALKRVGASEEVIHCVEKLSWAGKASAR